MLIFTKAKLNKLISKHDIPLHQDELKQIGIEVLPLKGLQFTSQGLHRDDHYMFIIQNKGHFVFELDFNMIEINNAGICYVAPGQVQRYLKCEQCEGWLLFLNTDHLSKQVRDNFDTMLNVTQHVHLDQQDLIFSFAYNLERWWLSDKPTDKLSPTITRGLLDSISGLMASKLLGASTSFKYINSSKYLLATRFKQSINLNFLTIKQVKDYAALLHITPLYLNEVMKEITGFPASYWIQQEIILEAKRLLSYSEKDIKEIAWDLGYEDHTYFSRFFKKHTGHNASAFRTNKP